MYYRTILVVSTTLFLMLAAGAASAAPRVFHSPSDDGAEPVGVPTLPTDDDLLFLWVVGDGLSSTSGVVCTDGNGDELCGWDVLLHPGVNVEFGAFTPEPGVVSSSDPTELRANGIDLGAPAPLPIRIGTLQVFATVSGVGGLVYADGVQVVTADLTGEPIQSETIAALPVPEAGLALQSAFLIVAAACLSRSRKARTDPVQSR